MLLAVARPALALLDPELRATVLSNVASEAAALESACPRCGEHVYTEAEDNVHRLISAGVAIGFTWGQIDDVVFEAAEHGDVDGESCFPDYSFED